jgi:hypothetical protein
MKKEIKYLYEDPKIYDGYCAIVYTDGTFELRDHWAVNYLTESERKQLCETIQKMIDEDSKTDDTK